MTDKKAQRSVPGPEPNPDQKPIALRRDFLTGAMAGAAAITAGTVNISCGSDADAADDVTSTRRPRATTLAEMDDYFSSGELGMMSEAAKGLSLGMLDEQILFHAGSSSGVNHFEAEAIAEEDFRGIEMAFAAANQRHASEALAHNGVGVSFASQAYASTSVTACCCCCPCCSCCYAASAPAAVQTA